jgi:hypothetical protein
MDMKVCKFGDQYRNHPQEQRGDKKQLTAANVAGKKTIPKMAKAFILPTSCLDMLEVSYQVLVCILGFLHFPLSSENPPRRLFLFES